MRLTQQSSRSCRLVMISLIGIVLLSQKAHAVALNQKDVPVVATLFSTTKPQCIGRYIIDVPQSFNNQLNNMVFIDDFRIESKTIYLPAFKQRIALREKALHDAVNKPGNVPDDAPFIKQIIQLPDGKGVIFDHNESGADDAYRKLEAHVYVDGVAFIITTDILDLSSPRYIDEKKSYIASGFTEAETNTKPAKLMAMQSLIARLHGRKDEDIPQPKGLCIPNGFIQDDDKTHTEEVGFSYENDDFIVGITMDNTLNDSSDDDKLFNREERINEALKHSKKYIIKKSKLSPGGIVSEEWLFGGKQEIEKTETAIYNFILYANEAGPSQTKPWLKIGLNSEYKKTRYSEAQMIDIWARLVNSLRYGPNANAS